jgi:hypothetical protein
LKVARYANTKNNAAAELPPTRPTSSSIRTNLATSPLPTCRERYEPIPIEKRYVPITVEN